MKEQKKTRGRASSPLRADEEKEEIMKKFIKAAAIRAARTIAQTAIATIGTSAVLADVNWAVVASASALAGILSLLTSVVTGLPETEGTKNGGGNV